ncbi:hypothetical protein ACWGST_15230 [Agromyces sp. NPDC055520]
MISRFAGCRLPDAARVAFYDRKFAGPAHRAIAVKGMDPGLADAVLADHRTAPISERLAAALVFLECLTRNPDELSAADAQAALAAGLSRQDLEDVAAVGAVFAVITRNANALDYEIPSVHDFDRAASMLLRRGYA